MTLEQQRIKKLCELMEELEKQGKEEQAKLLYWAIFELERVFVHNR